jgi:hypothetical protein
MSVGESIDEEVIDFSAAPTMGERRAIVPASESFAWPTLSVDVAVLRDCLSRCVAAGVRYRLGAKVDNWRQAPGDAAGQFSAVDCSGFVGWALAQASSGGALGRLCYLGSVEQREWIEAAGCKLSSISAGSLADGALRIAFLLPRVAGGRIVRVGHVALVWHGLTLESYSGNGPGRRGWDGKGWQSEALLYVLTPPV